VYRVGRLLCRLLESVPLGTNLDLGVLFWMLWSGRLLRSRGAVVPALADSRLTEREVRRCWAGLAYGRWRTQALLDAGWQVIREEGDWHPRPHGGYQVFACDLVGFERPRLRGCPTKDYRSAKDRSVPAIRLGMAGSVGEVRGKRVLALRTLLRAPAGADGRYDVPSHRAALLQEVKKVLEPDELLAADAGFGVREMQAAGIDRYLVRARSSFTARRAQAPPYQGTGRRPARGQQVRPLPRKRNGRTIPATPPDREEVWTEETAEGALGFAAWFWDDLVLTDAPFVDGEADAPRFGAIVLCDPRYGQPLLVITPQRLSGKEALSAYTDRWPIEQVPQTAKQILGALRQFVFAPQTCQRLPELALLAGAMLNYVAATTPAIPSGFWDRAPQSTAGRLRRVLGRYDLRDLRSVLVSQGELRKKESVTGHLPKGVAAHRRVQGEHLLPREARKQARAAPVAPA
jgi:hypothetical protein